MDDGLKDIENRDAFEPGGFVEAVVLVVLGGICGAILTYVWIIP